MEAGVGAEGTEILHPSEMDAPRVARSISPFEEREGVLDVAQRAAERSQMYWSPVSFAESVDQFVAQSARA